MGLIQLDAGVLIGFLDAADAHHQAAREAFTDALDAGERLAMAASALAECLVGPARRSEEAIGTVRDLVDRLPISIVPLDADISVAAARLRAAHKSLRLPDALVIATAIATSADALITTDRRWPAAKTLKLRAQLRII